MVLEHAVRVEAGAKSLRVGTGQAVSFAGGRLSGIRAVDTETRLSWLQGRLVTLIFDVSRAEFIPDLLRQGISARVETWTP